MTPWNSLCLPEKLISKHAPLKSEHEIYRPTQGIEPRLLRQTVPVGAYCVSANWATKAGRRGPYVCTKFEADSYIRSKVIRGPKISKLGHVTLSHANFEP